GYGRGASQETPSGDEHGTAIEHRARDEPRLTPPRRSQLARQERSVDTQRVQAHEHHDKPSHICADDDERKGARQIESDTSPYCEGSQHAVIDVSHIPAAPAAQSWAA